MLTTGSKIYLKIAATVYGLALVYGFVSNTAAEGIGKGLSKDGAVDNLLGPLTFGYKGGVGDRFGYGVLMGVAALAAGLAAVHVAFRDGNVEVSPATNGDQPGTTRPAMSESAWPFLGAVAVGLVIVGLANSPVIFTIGVLALVLIGFEWVLDATADQVSDDPAVNSTARKRLGMAFELPVGLVLFAAVMVISISRLFIASSKLGASIGAVAVAAIFLALGFYMASRERMSRRSLLAIVALVLFGVLAAGIGGAIAGPGDRPHEEEEATTEGEAMGISLAYTSGLG
jgi:hypothetical protein